MRALVLTGGGARGAYQAGVLKRLMGDEGLDYDIFCGVSVGALNVAGLSLCPKGDPRGSSKSLENIWLGIEGNKSIYKKWFPFGLPALWRGSIYDTKPLSRLIKQYVNAESIATSGRHVVVGAVSMTTGDYRTVQGNDPDIVSWVHASCSFPIFFSSVQISGETWSDGGLKQNIPLAEAIRLGANEIDVVSCLNPWSRTNWNTNRGLFKQLDRVIDLMSSEMIKDDIRQTGLMNDLAHLDQSYKKVKVRLFVPSRGINGDPLDFHPQKIRECISLGYSDAISPRILGD